MRSTSQRSLFLDPSGAALDDDGSCSARREFNGSVDIWAANNTPTITLTPSPGELSHCVPTWTERRRHRSAKPRVGAAKARVRLRKRQGRTS